MGIFTNYDNLSEDYIPDNVSPQYPDEIIEGDILPKPFYDIKGNFIGYTWNLTDTFVWEIEFDNILKGDVVMELYDFRWEHIHTFSHFNDNKLLVKIDNSINDILRQGVYYAVVKNTDDVNSKIITKYLIFVQ